MRVGDTVRITEGPLVGRQALFAGNEGQRAWIVVELQGRQLDIEMDLNWIGETVPRRRSISGVVEAPGTQLRRA